jgi:hypothetical protein
VYEAVAGFFSEDPGAPSSKKRPHNNGFSLDPFYGADALPPNPNRSFGAEYRLDNTFNNSSGGGHTVLTTMDNRPFLPMNKNNKPNNGAAMMPSILDVLEQEKMLKQFERQLNISGSGDESFSFHADDDRPLAWRATGANNSNIKNNNNNNNNNNNKSNNNNNNNNNNNRGFNRSTEWNVDALPNLVESIYAADSSFDKTHSRSRRSGAKQRQRQQPQQQQQQQQQQQIPNVSLVDVATPTDGATALNRLRILSQKHGEDPNSIPFALDDHKKWMREQDELDRVKSKLMFKVH